MTKIEHPPDALEMAVDAAVRAVPDWRGRAIMCVPALDGVVSPVHRGVASHCWKVSLDGEAPAWFLKVLHDDMVDFVDVAGSYKAASAAAISGVTPTPRYFPSPSAAIFDLLPDGWNWARLHDFNDPDLVACVVAARRAIQAGPTLGRAQNLFVVIADYAQRAEAAQIALPPDAWWLISQAVEIGRAIEAAGAEIRPCHLDGASSNVMLSLEGEVRLVDFDSAGDADPHWDLGVMMAEICQFEPEEAAIVEIFAGGYDKRIHHRARLYGAADDIKWGLWGYLVAAGSSRRGVEFVKYAEWRLLRARMVLHDPRFEGMLRHV
jgi:Phosphotransferase enzyme family